MGGNSISYICAIGYLSVPVFFLPEWRINEHITTIRITVTAGIPFTCIIVDHR